MERYEQGRKIGEGSYGVVYEVRAKESNPVDGCWPLALKQIRVLTDAQKRLVEKERDVLASLQDHPNILKFVDSFQSYYGFLPYICIVTENCRFGTLQNIVEDPQMQDTPISEESVRDYILQLAEGLKHIHAKGYTHRDLKSNNIFVVESQECQKKMLRIADFGLAEVVGCNKDLEAGDKVLLPPECDGAMPVPATTFGDVWALGLILVELCTRTRPSRRGSLGSIMASKGAWSKQLEYLEEILGWMSSSYSPDICKLGSRLLYPDCRYRFTADETCRALRGEVFPNPPMATSKVQLRASNGMYLSTRASKRKMLSSVMSSSSSKRDDYLVLCRDSSSDSWWSWEDGCLRHVSTGLWVHPKGGQARPDVHIVLHPNPPTESIKLCFENGKIIHKSTLLTFSCDSSDLGSSDKIKLVLGTQPISFESIPIHDLQSGPVV